MSIRYLLAKSLKKHLKNRRILTKMFPRISQCSLSRWRECQLCVRLPWCPCDRSTPDALRSHANSVVSFSWLGLNGFTQTGLEIIRSQCRLLTIYHIVEKGPAISQSVDSLMEYQAFSQTKLSSVWSTQTSIDHRMIFY